jgi:hypothetical protein
MGALLLTAAMAVGDSPGMPGDHDQVDVIGDIRIEGNLRTPEKRIREILGQSVIYPGQVLPSRAVLLWVELNLLFQTGARFDLFHGKRPSLHVLPRAGDPPVRDIEVRFPEVPDLAAKKVR